MNFISSEYMDKVGFVSKVCLNVLLFTTINPAML